MRSTLAGKRALAAACAALLGTSVMAAEVCYSAAQPSGNATLPTSATVFACPNEGSRTIAELAAQGYAIVRMRPVASAQSTIVTQLLIRRDPALHTDGFEP